MPARTGSVNFGEQVKMVEFASDKHAEDHLVIAAFEAVTDIAVHTRFSPMHLPLQRHQEFGAAIHNAQPPGGRTGCIELDLRIHRQRKPALFIAIAKAPGR